MGLLQVELATLQLSDLLFDDTDQFQSLCFLDDCQTFFFDETKSQVVMILCEIESALKKQQFPTTNIEPDFQQGFHIVLRLIDDATDISQDLFALQHIPQADIGIKQMEIRLKQAYFAPFVSFYTFDIKCHEEASFSLNVITDLKVEHPQIGDTICIVHALLSFLVSVEGLRVSSDGFVPLCDLEVTPAQSAMNIGHLNSKHGRVYRETGYNLCVISGCSFILQFSLLAIPHQQAPLGIRTVIDRTMFLLELIKKILQLLYPIALDKLQCLIQVILNEKSAIRTIGLF